MKKWIAVAYAALDLSSYENGSFNDVVYAIIPTVHFDEPIGLAGEPAELWKRLLNGPIGENSVSESDNVLLQEFERFGIASSNLECEHRISQVGKPWLVSPLHELVYGWLDSLARANAINIVFIKGPALKSQGIRSKVHSGDIDIWVQPDQLDQLKEILQGLGWKLTPSVWLGTEFSHSESLGNHAWACEIDLHRFMPGISLPPSNAFDYVISTAEQKIFAGKACTIPNANVHRVLYALHELRPEFDLKPSSNKVESCIQMFRHAGAVSLESVYSLGSEGSLASVLKIAFPNETIFLQGTLPLNWRWLSSRNRIIGYSMALNSLPLGSRIRVLWRLFWPDENIVRQTNEHAGIHVLNVGLMGRCKRIKRAIFGTKRLF